METKEKVFQALKRFGLMPQEEDDGRILFFFQMTLYMYVPDADDPGYVAIYTPDIHEVGEGNEVEVMQVVNECNMKMKASKLMMVGNASVWGAFEMYVADGEEFDDMIRRGIICLHDTKSMFEREMKGL